MRTRTGTRWRYSRCRMVGQGWCIAPRSTTSWKSRSPGPGNGSPRDRSDLQDIFHSRLAVSTDGRHLLSAGWIWQPFDTVEIYDLPLALEQLRALDAFTLDDPWTQATRLEIS